MTINPPCSFSFKWSQVVLFYIKILKVFQMGEI